MGDVGAALPSVDRVFFYNPAQLPSVSSHFTIAGVQVAASRHLDDFIRFFDRRVEPAIEAEFDMESEALNALYRDARALDRHPTRGHGAVVLPSFVYSTNRVGVGGGLFAKTALNYRVEDRGDEIPEVYLLSRTDIMALASVGIELGMFGLPGLSIGLTGTRTQRFLAFKNKPLDTFTTEESSILLRGDVYQLDVGMLYSPSRWELPGTPVIGGAVYDVLDQQYDYDFGGAPDRMPFLDEVATGSGEVENRATLPEAEGVRPRFELETSYRFGVAYRLASLFVLDDVNLAVDYQGESAGMHRPLTRIHAGLQARVAGPVVLRGGIGAGHPTGGLGLRIGPLFVDYAFHGIDEGRLPRERSTYVHVARLTLRIQ